MEVLTGQYTKPLIINVPSHKARIQFYTNSINTGSGWKLHWYAGERDGSGAQTQIRLWSRGTVLSTALNGEGLIMVKRTYYLTVQNDVLIFAISLRTVAGY